MLYWIWNKLTKQKNTISFNLSCCFVIEIQFVYKILFVFKILLVIKILCDWNTLCDQNNLMIKLFSWSESWSFSDQNTLMIWPIKQNLKWCTMYIVIWSETFSLPCGFIEEKLDFRVLLSGNAENSKKATFTSGFWWPTKTEQNVAIFRRIWRKRRIEWYSQQNTSRKSGP